MKHYEEQNVKINVFIITKFEHILLKRRIWIVNFLMPAKNGEKQEIARFELGRDAGLEDEEG